MPIIFEDRLGNSESAQRLRKIYRLNHLLWTLYYAIFFGVLGLFLALLLAQGNPIVGLLVAAFTIGGIILLFKRRSRPGRRR